MALSTLALCAFAVVAAPAAADDDKHKKTDGLKRSLMHEISEEMRLGKLKIEGDADAIEELVLKRDIPVTYDYIEVLMRTPNAFGPGPACIVCHSSSDPQYSYRGLDLSTCEGILAGSTEEPVEKVVIPGDAKHSSMRRRLRNNRMPLGVAFTDEVKAEPLALVSDWIRDGAKDDKHFKDKVLPLFTTPGAFVDDTPACSECHMSNQEPPSFHELDLTSHAGIMLGADSVAKGVENSTKVVIPGKPAESSIVQHLVENRMPPGIAPTEDRDHPNTILLLRWIDQGAKCQ